MNETKKAIDGRIGGTYGMADDVVLNPAARRGLERGATLSRVPTSPRRKLDRSVQAGVGRRPPAK